MKSIFTFPFEPIGLGLRTLSLSGVYGNILAIFLYCILCGSPVFYLLYRKKKQRVIKEDCILAILSICLFAGIFLFINPGYIRYISVPNMASDNYLIAIGSTLWSLLICYITLRILHDVEQKESINLLQALHALLIVIIIFTVINILGIRLFSLITEIQQFARQNTDMLQELSITEDTNLTPTYIWLIVKYGLDNIPSLLLLWTIHLSMKLIRTLQNDSFSEEAVILSEKLGIRCKNVVIAISLLVVITNVLQILFSRLLLNSQYQILIPIDSLILVFIILLLSRKISENRTLKVDNDSFI